MAEQITDIVSLASAPDGLYLLMVSSDEPDAGQGIGRLYRTDGSRKARLQAVLNTNDLLRRLWVSPQGSVWIASEAGHVHTSAVAMAAGWPAPTQPGLVVKPLLAELPFVSTTLPPPAHRGGRPTLGEIWGTSDEDVHVAASGGHLYRWNGREWTLSFTAPAEILGFGGRAGDVYAVGEQGTLLHFDGSAWSMLASPDEAATDRFTACHAAPGGGVLVCSLQGRVLHGSAQGWTVLARHDERQFMDITRFGERVLLAARDKGCMELTPDGLVDLKPGIHLSELVPVHGHVCGLGEATVTSYIDHDPADAVPWARVKF